MGNPSVRFDEGRSGNAEPTTTVGSTRLFLLRLLYLGGFFLFVRGIAEFAEDAFDHDADFSANSFALVWPKQSHAPVLMSASRVFRPSDRPSTRSHSSDNVLNLPIPFRALRIASTAASPCGSASSPSAPTTTGSSVKRMPNPSGRIF